MLYVKLECEEVGIMLVLQVYEWVLWRWQQRFDMIFLRESGDSTFRRHAWSFHSLLSRGFLHEELRFFHSSLIFLVSALCVCLVFFMFISIMLWICIKLKWFDSFEDELHIVRTINLIVINLESFVISKEVLPVENVVDEEWLTK